MGNVQEFINKMFTLSRCGRRSCKTFYRLASWNLQRGMSLLIRIRVLVVNLVCSWGTSWVFCTPPEMTECPDIKSCSSFTLLCRSFEKAPLFQDERLLPLLHSLTLSVSPTPHFGRQHLRERGTISAKRPPSTGILKNAGPSRRSPSPQISCRQHGLVLWHRQRCHNGLQGRELQPSISMRQRGAASARSAWRRSPRSAWRRSPPSRQCLTLQKAAVSFTYTTLISLICLDKR